MDGLKLNRWKENFQREVGNVMIEFNAFFKDKALNEFYLLQVDTSDELSLQISEDLPKEITERLTKLLIETKPEDSV
jgi:hypothetical protein